MTLTLILVSSLVAALLSLLVWALWGSARAVGPATGSAAEESGRVHVGYLGQIRQALSSEDDQFLLSIGGSSLRRRVRQERRRVALSYLAALRLDFEKLLRTARMIAALSPEVTAVQELERLRLTLSFQWRYRIIWMSLRAGYTPLPQMSNLSDLLSGYSVRLEAAIRELGEQAALVGEMVSSPDRRRTNLI